MMAKRRGVLGLTETVMVSGRKEAVTLRARIDTGAARCSIDTRLAEHLGIGSVSSSRIVKSAHGRELRRIAFFDIEMQGMRYRSSFSITDRDHMKYRVLVGRNLLMKGRFLIDPGKGSR